MVMVVFQRSFKGQADIHFSGFEEKRVGGGSLGKIGEWKKAKKKRRAIMALTKRDVCEFFFQSTISISYYAQGLRVVHFGPH